MTLTHLAPDGPGRFRPAAGRPGTSPAGSDAVAAAGPPRVLLVGENASLRMGGEASYPYFFLTRLRERGVEAWLVTHGRCREELRGLLDPETFARVRFVDDVWFDVALWKLGDRLPRKMNEQTLGVVRHLISQLRMRRAAARLVREKKIEVVHETIPISPKAPSAMFGLGVPVVIGPLAGGMDYPPAFQWMQSGASRAVERFGRAVSHAVNRLVPGKLRADALVVANERSLKALPRGVTGAVYQGLTEISVDLDVWGESATRPPRHGGPARFVYLGRLVDWKAVDLLVDAFRTVADGLPGASLEILGDGPLRGALEARSRELGLADRVAFAGWVTPTEGAARLREADVFVLPSLRECGGGVILEAMALGLPVVATGWGGPGEYLDDECGIRVPPDSRAGLVAGLAEAMLRLGRDPDLRARMGRAARERVTGGLYSWGRKIDVFLDIYRETVDRAATARG